MDKKDTIQNKIGARVTYYRFIKFISSGKVLLALLIPVLLVDYLVPIKDTSLFYWFLILYGFFVVPLSYSFYFRGGKQRLAVLESGDLDSLKKLNAQDNLKYIVILVGIGIVLLYGFFI